MNIGIISGSARPNNNTIKLAKAIENHHIKLGNSTQILNFIDYDLGSSVIQPLDLDQLSIFQQKSISLFKNSSIIYFLSPEYNWMPTVEILNFINHFAQKNTAHLLEEKVFAFAGISIGRGGKLPALDMKKMLDKVIGYFSILSITSSKIFECHEINQVLDENGKSLNNSEFDKGLENFCNYQLRLHKKFM